jgi:polyisoprenoid-binding protein YceI
MKTLLKLGLLTAVIGAFAFHPPVEKTSQKVNTSKSTVVWNGYKVLGSHTGNVNLKNGALEFDSKNNLTGGSFELDMKSIVCNDLTGGTADKLVGHLKSDDFFSVEKFPTSKFVITSAKKKGTGNTYTVTGNLTIKGITHPVTFDADVVSRGNNSTATAKIVVDRTKYDVRYGSGKFFDNLGDSAINDNFDLVVSIESAK